MRRISWIMCLMAVAGMTGCHLIMPEEKEEQSGAMSEVVWDATVETQIVTTSSFTRTRTYVGNISASKSVKVIPLASERILRFPWENGDFVKQGEVIAEIRNEVSRKGLDALNAQMRSIDAQLSAAEREYKRVQSMYESNIVSRQNFDQAADSVTTLKASKQQLAASMEQSRLGLDYATVVAPIDGVVSQKNSEVGDVASSAMPLCVLLDMSKLKVTLNVNEGDSAYMRVGQDVNLRFDAYPGEVVIAKITRILPYVNTTTRTNTIEAEFENSKNELTDQYRYKPGMYARAEIGLETTNNAVVVPPTALLLDPELLIQQLPGQSLRKAFILKPDMTVESRVVEIGEQNGGIVEVIKGLSVGDKLIVRGQHSLHDGDRVKDVTKRGEMASATAGSQNAGVAGNPSVEGT